MRWRGTAWRAFVARSRQRAELVRIRRAHRPPARGLRHRRPGDEGRRPGAPLRRRPRLAASRCSSTHSARAGGCRLALGVDDLEEHARAIAELVRTTRARERSRARASSPEAPRARPRPAARGLPRPLPGSRAHGRRRRPRRAPHPHLLAGRRRSVHHAPPGHHARSRTKVRNVGCYRMQKLDRAHAPRCTGRCTRRGRATSAAAKEMGLDRLDVAVALGGDPALTYAATAPLPDGIDEWMFAGFLRRRAVGTMRARRSTWRSRPTRTSSSRGTSIHGRRRSTRGPSATTPGTTRRSTTSPGST